MATFNPLEIPDAGKSLSHGLSREHGIPSAIECSSHALDTSMSSDGARSQWSLLASATDRELCLQLGESTVDIHRLGVSLLADMDRIDANVAILNELRHLNVPEIRISTSTCTLPQSPSSRGGSPSPDKPILLATRRGRNLPAPLTLKLAEPPEIDSYPGIPTAFRGSPLDQSPRFSLQCDRSVSPIPVSDMIGNLRSQIANLTLPSPQDPRSFEPPPLPSRSPPLSPEDEWAFAQDLLAQYGALAMPRPSIVTNLDAAASVDDDQDLQPSSKGRQRSSAPGSLTRRPLEAQSQTYTRKPSRIDPPQTGGQSKRHSEQVLIDARRPQSTPATSTRVPAPISVPLSPRTDRHVGPRVLAPSTPVTPAFMESDPARDAPTPRKIHGILKRAKSVHFAPPPARDGGNASADRTPTQEPLKTTSPIWQPSPLRECFTIADDAFTTTRLADAFVLGNGDSASANITLPHLTTPDHRRPQAHHTPQTQKDNFSGARVGPFVDKLNRSDLTTVVSPGRVPAASAKVPKGSRSVSPQLHRKAKGLRSRKGSMASAEKENKRSPFRISLGTASISTPQRDRKNENEARRDSGGASQSAGGQTPQKGRRRSTPLKSFITLKRLR